MVNLMVNRGGKTTKMKLWLALSAAALLSLCSTACGEAGKGAASKCFSS
jgi:hypothetical protein